MPGGVAGAQSDILTAPMPIGRVGWSWSSATPSPVYGYNSGIRERRSSVASGWALHLHV